MLMRPSATAETRWTEEQDARLVKLAHIYGERNWGEIAEFFPDKSEIRCRERYQDVIKPGRNSATPWTPEEDEQLLVAVIRNGVGNWSTIAKDLPGRTDRGCLQRWRYIDPVSAREHYGKKRLARSFASFNASTGRDLERTQLTADDLLKVIVPAPDQIVSADFRTVFPTILYEAPLEELEDVPPELGGVTRN